MDMQGILLATFLSLGGMAVIVKMGKKFIPQLIDKGIDALLLFPAVKKFVAENQKDLKELIDTITKELLEDIEDTTKPEEPPKAK